MISAGSPFVRIEFDAAQSTADVWARARAINPFTMDYTAHVRSVPISQGRVWMTAAVSQADYAKTVAGLDLEEVPAAIEAILVRLAADVLEKHKPIDTIDEISVADKATEYGPTTFIVRWKVEEAIAAYNMIAQSCDVLQGITLIRLTDVEDGTLSLAISLPHRVYHRATDYYREDFVPDSLAEHVFTAISHFHAEEQDDKRDGVLPPCLWPFEGDIPA